MTRTNLEVSLKQAIALGTPVEVFDPATNELYYLVSAEQFAKSAAAVPDGFSTVSAYPPVDGIMAEDDAADPLLESYQ